MVASGRSSFREDAPRGLLIWCLSVPMLRHAESLVVVPHRGQRHRYQGNAACVRSSGTRWSALAAGRVCREVGGLDLGCCPPRDRLRSSRPAGQLHASATGHEGGLARSARHWENWRVPKYGTRSCQRADKSGGESRMPCISGKSKLEDASQKHARAPDKTFLKITAQGGCWTFRPRAPCSGP